MSNNIITIRGGTFPQVKKALKQWLDLYADQIHHDFEIELKHIDRGVFVVELPDSIDDESFFYLVNYLYYPENIFYKAEILGYAKGKDNIRLRSKDLMVFVATEDQEHDNVSITTAEGQAYKWWFGSRIKEVALQRSYEPPIKYTREEEGEFLRPTKINENSKQDADSIRVGNRFNIIFIAALVLFLAFLSLFLITTDTEEVSRYYKWCEAGIAAWFFFDYEMLQHKHFYQRSIQIAATVLTLSLVLLSYFTVNDPHLFLLFGLAPLILLFLQWPLRRIYLQWFKEEPVIDDRKSFKSFFYTIILFVGTMIISSLIAGIPYPM